MQTRFLYFAQSVVQIGVKNSSKKWSKEDIYFVKITHTFLLVGYKMRCQLTHRYEDPQSFVDKDMGRDLWHVTS